MNNRITFLKNQASKLDKYGIVYQSITVNIDFDEKLNEFIKKPIFPIEYKNISLSTSFLDNKNALFIPLGKYYKGLIGVNVDNKKNKKVRYLGYLQLEQVY